VCTCFTLRVALGLSVCFRIFLVSGMFVLGGGRGVLARQRQFRLDISGNSSKSVSARISSVSWGRHSRI